MCAQTRGRGRGHLRGMRRDVRAAFWACAAATIPVWLALWHTEALLVARVEAHDALKEVEWTTLAFFVGLFVLVEAVIQVGIVSGIANALAEWAGGDATVATLGILWFSAIVSAFVDNIPYTATAIPIVKELGAGGIPIEPMWWALSLGACLGGNLTIVGASANVVVANVAERAGHPISFALFLRYGAIVVLGSLLISSVYVWLRYVM